MTELGGSPVAGAALSLYKNLLHLQSTVSNSSGQYSFNGLSNGRYTITIDSGCVPVFGNMSAFISCASVERNFECTGGLGESKRQEAAARLNLLKTFNGIDNKGRQADNGDMDATADQGKTSAISHQPSARTEASVAEYLFYHCDHLGTVRLITNASGAVVSRHDYEPFGVEIAPTVETANNTHRFTGHERDASTGYDYMHYRSYGSNLGRFMKPDNITGNPLNPQSWNLYSYVRGNPVNFNDPTGHQAMESTSSGDQNASDAAEPTSDMVTPGGATGQQQKEERQRKIVLILVGMSTDTKGQQQLNTAADVRSKQIANADPTADVISINVGDAHEALKAVKSVSTNIGPISDLEIISHAQQDEINAAGNHVNAAMALMVNQSGDCISTIQNKPELGLVASDMKALSIPLKFSERKLERWIKFQYLRIIEEWNMYG